MVFKPGQGGRLPGASNKRTREFAAILEARGFCAATALMDCYEEAKKTYDNYGVINEAIIQARADKEGTSLEFASPTEDNAHKYLKIAADIAKEIASYSFPKLKSIERPKNSPLDGMTPQEKLQAMKQAVLMLEMQVKGESK